MATMTRTDIHRPSSPDFDPEAYSLISVIDLYPDDEDMNGAAAWHELQARLKAMGSPKRASHNVHGTCGHCGTRIRYAAYMLHEPTNEIITVGEECLDNRFEALTKGEFQHLRKAAKLNRERRTAKEQRDTRVARMTEYHPALAIFGDYDALSALHNTFLRDLHDQAHRRDLTTKQMDAAVKAIERAQEWQAKRAAEMANSSPAPEGKTVVTGEVVKVKDHDTGFGLVEKMIVKADEGYRVWVTVPAALDGVDEGERVTFTATLTPSDTDATFAFGKRPTKAAVL